MTLIAYLVVGLIAGAIAKAIVPGKQGGGFILTTILGIIGAFVGGLIGQLMTGDSFDNIWSIGGLISAVVGAIVVLIIFGLVNKNKA